MISSNRNLGRGKQLSQRLGSDPVHKSHRDLPFLIDVDELQRPGPDCTMSVGSGWIVLSTGIHLALCP